MYQVQYRLRSDNLIDQQLEMNRSGAISFAAMVFDIVGPGDAFHVDDSVLDRIFEFHGNERT